MADSDVFLGQRFLLVGLTGNGKSSTGNSILDKREFTPRSGTYMLSYDVRVGRATVEGIPLEVVDGPGLGDTSTDVTEDGQSMNELVRDALALISNQFDALIVVMKYGVRLTDHEKETVNVIKMIFGNDVISSHGVIVMTHGDQFDKDAEEYKITFENWCDTQTGYARSLFDECHKRCVLFDNKTKDNDKKRKQVKQLLTTVDSMKLMRPPYTEEDFKKGETGRHELVVMGKMPDLASKTENILEDITRRINEIRKHNQDDGIDKLQNNCREIQKISTELQEFKKWLQDEDSGTKLVDQLLMKIYVNESRIRTLADLESRRLENAQIRLENSEIILQKSDIILEDSDIISENSDGTLENSDGTLENANGIIENAKCKTNQDDQTGQAIPFAPKRKSDRGKKYQQRPYSTVETFLWFQTLFVPVIVAYTLKGSRLI